MPITKIVHFLPRKLKITRDLFQYKEITDSGKIISKFYQSIFYRKTGKGNRVGASDMSDIKLTDRPRTGTKEVNTK